MQLESATETGDAVTGPTALLTASPSPASPSPESMAETIRSFLSLHPLASVLEDGKVAFELSDAQHTLSTEHNRCTLHLWSGERSLVRTVVAVTARKGSLQLLTQRFGHTQAKLLNIVSEAQRRTPGKREPVRKQYARLLERVLVREFPEWKPEAFRTAMDLERSFGPAYTRGSLLRGKEAWAVIGVGETESQAIIDGVLTLGILWLHHCRERGNGRRLYKGLRLVVPRGAGALTLARLPWMNTAAAQWELQELDERTEELTACDPADQGNLRTRLVRLPDEAAAQERFAKAIHEVMQLVPDGEQHRVEQRLRSTAELGFLLHGLEFARARISLAPGGFGHTLEITFGHGATQTVLTPARRERVQEHVRELFERRHPFAAHAGRRLRPGGPTRSIGAFTGRAAHGRMQLPAAENRADLSPASRLALRERALAAQNDPLYRAVPERWLESVLRENLAPLTRFLAFPPRSLAPAPHGAGTRAEDRFANDPDPDTRGNRADVPEEPSRPPHAAWRPGEPGTPMERTGRPPALDRVIPRFDPRFVYTQVPAIAGASDRGMLDLLGVMADGRLAVIELKVADDLQLALQGLDYWIRVRHHQAQATDPTTGLPMAMNDLQRHGYFREAALSALPPRLYLIAPALHVHPATETILRYLSPRVEWTLLALDERWRQEVRVLWRKSGGTSGAA